jgi:ribonuclease HI
MDVNNRPTKFARKIRIYTDAAIRPDQGTSGLAAIVRSEDGQIRYWWSERAGTLTCNEAEYAAVIFALEQLKKLQDHNSIQEIEIISDSRVVVDQMSGRAAAHAPNLRQAQNRLRVLVAGFHKVSFHHIGREQNRLADALAFEAVNGDYSPSPRPVLECPHPDAWDQLIQLWSKP